MTDDQIFEKALNRVGRNKTDKEIIVSLEKEIDYLRNRVQDKLEENITWFRVNSTSDLQELHKFLLSYVPMGEVLKLYKLLKQSMEV